MQGSILYAVILFLSILFCIAYCGLILLYRYWLKIPAQTEDNKENAGTHFTIIIPARNEENNIEKCIRSIAGNDYPQELYEIIIVDDFSTDNTAAIVSDLQSTFPFLRLVQLKDYVDGKINSYKKKAIETAVSFSNFDFILTTDADCTVSDGWLSAYDALIKRAQPVFVAAPVKIKTTGSFVSLFQMMDFLSLQGITMAAVGSGVHTLCNGANLGYAKSAFHAVNGFEGIDSIASGDDMLLMHKINKKFPGRTFYLFQKNAVVETLPMQNWKAFFNQRIRWASKSGYYQDKRLLPILLVVYVFNLLLLLLPIVSIWNAMLLTWWLYLLAAKTISEIIFLLPVARFFECRKSLIWFPFLQPIHIIYTVIAGFLGKFSRFEWKGRVVE